MVLRKRAQALYQIDNEEPIRTSHANAAVRELYAEFLGAPLGQRSHELLHTHYAQREVLV